MTTEELKELQSKEATLRIEQLGLNEDYDEWRKRFRDIPIMGATGLPDYRGLCAATIGEIRAIRAFEQEENQKVYFASLETPGGGIRVFTVSPNYRDWYSERNDLEYGLADTRVIDRTTGETRWVETVDVRKYLPNEIREKTLEDFKINDSLNKKYKSMDHEVQDKVSGMWR